MMIHRLKNNKKKKKKNNTIATAATILVLTIIMAASSMAAPAAATTTTQPPVTAATDNGSVNVVINWEPRQIEPNQDIDFTFDFQDPSSGESISHVNYNFEIIDEIGETIQSMTDLHTHSGSDVQTVTFDTTGRFNLVVTIIGTGIDPPFDTTQSGTAQTAIAVGQQSPAAATTDGNTTATTTTSNATTTTTTSLSPRIELSPQPVYRERQIPVSQTPINQTHILFTDSGNGTLTLPNATEDINVTSIDNVIVSTIDGTATGKEVFTTLDGSESATGTIYAIARFNMEEGTGKAIVLLLLNTNSTGRLAPLDSMIWAGHLEFQPDGSVLSTMWEWQSGIPLPPTTEEPPLMNTTTNATEDINVTAAP